MKDRPTRCRRRTRKSSWRGEESATSSSATSFTTSSTACQRPSPSSTAALVPLLELSIRTSSHTHSLGLGWIVVGASVAHEPPQELSDFVVLYNSGLYVSELVKAAALSQLLQVHQVGSDQQLHVLPFSCAGSMLCLLLP